MGDELNFIVLLYFQMTVVGMVMADNKELD